MKLRIVIQFAMVLVLSAVGCRAAGAPDYTAAGIVAYTKIQGRTYVLLADHLDSNRGWGSFGGNREAAEAIEETALREFREETRCTYDSLLTIDLSGMPTIDYRIFVSYVVELPYVPAQVFANRPAAADCQGPGFDERGPWVWVPLEEIIRCLEAGEETASYELDGSLVPAGTSTTLWLNSAVLLRQAVEDGLLE
jgi:8-oxo-dGTP pyrophosphatase MutT (NUDIX family)